MRELGGEMKFLLKLSGMFKKRGNKQRHKIDRRFKQNLLAKVILFFFSKTNDKFTKKSLCVS